MAPVMLQRLDLWQQRLQADDIAFADLRPALQTQEKAQPVFFRTDVHMNAEGARAAALAVAQAALPLLGGQRGAQAFEESAPGPLQPLPGDLLALAGLADAPAGWRPRRDQV
ncbi:alginate O-acetyltransferase AlgX-related protein, partial [Burkholderia sola]|uniref:alginate O-acetyltransferase AlgX-related protein n=1 Tax=Burkholderia sola TaxID=2843302 RepID=UPI00346B1B63